MYSRKREDPAGEVHFHLFYHGSSYVQFNRQLLGSILASTVSLLLRYYEVLDYSHRLSRLSTTCVAIHYCVHIYTQRCAKHARLVKSALTHPVGR